MKFFRSVLLFFVLVVASSQIIAQELKENEIFKIIECVRINRDDFHKTCSDLKKYRIMMHI